MTDICGQVTWHLRPPARATVGGSAIPLDCADAGDPCIGQGTPTAQQMRWCEAVAEASRGRAGMRTAHGTCGRSFS